MFCENTILFDNTCDLFEIAFEVPSIVTDLYNIVEYDSRSGNNAYFHMIGSFIRICVCILCKYLVAGRKIAKQLVRLCLSVINFPSYFCIFAEYYLR